MVTRSFWTGYLKLSLVTCPVAMTPATTNSEKVRFHTLNRLTGARVVSRYVDGVTGEPVEDDDELKGYERGEGQHVILDDDELDAVALDSTRTIDVEMFVARESIGWIWQDAPHYLAPNDTVGEEAFSVIRDAMAATGTVGISRLVMYRRERAVMLEPRGAGIVLWTLRYGDEVRDANDHFSAAKPRKVEPKLLALVKNLVDERTRPWAAEMVADPVQARLLDIIAAKKNDRKRAVKPKAAAPAAETGNVVDIMDALRRSLASDSKAAR